MFALPHDFSSMTAPAMIPVEAHTVAAGKMQQDSMQGYHLAGAALLASMAQVPPPYGTSEESSSVMTADIEESQRLSKGGKSAASIASGGSLNKTKLCTFFLSKGRCPRGKKCQFAHGEKELRHKPDLFKTEICHAFAATGKCRYGKKCSFAHSTTEVRGNAAPVPAARRSEAVGVPVVGRVPQQPQPTRSVSGVPQMPPCPQMPPGLLQTPPGIPQMPPPSDDIVNLKLELDLMKRASNELQSKIGNLERLVGNADNVTSANYSSMSGRSSSSGSLDAFGGEVSGVPSYDGLPSYDLLHPSQMQLLQEEVLFGGRGYQMAAPDVSRIGATIRLSV